MSMPVPKIKAKVKLVPKGSQVVILALVVILGISLIFTFYFFSINVSIFLPLSVSIVLLITIIVLWLLSHRHVDNKHQQSTEISILEENSSTRITIPQGELSSNDYLKIFEQAISSTIYRKPLPVPDGLVDQSGNPVPQSQDNAQRKVEVINSELRSLQDKLGITDQKLSSLEQQQLVSHPKINVDSEQDKIDENN